MEYVDVSEAHVREMADGEEVSEGDDTAEEIARLEALVGELRKKPGPAKKARFDGVEIPTFRHGPPKGAAKIDSEEGRIGKDKGKEKEEEREKAKQKREQEQAGAVAARAPPPKPAVKSGTHGADGAPQFRYLSASDNPALVKSVLERSLDNKFLISERELLAIAPEVRRTMRELTTTKRIPMGSGALLGERGPMSLSSSLLSSTDPVGSTELIAAEHSLPLRTIDMTFNDEIMCECILDQGAQFIAMRRDIWQSLGREYLPDKVMIIEAANETTSRTLGMVPNIKVCVSGLELSLQVQIVEKAPFEVLLGRPFYALTSCITRDFPDGEQHITLTDPNTSHTITIATKARERRRERVPRDGSQPGFH
jgi:hypothetical protein